MEKVISPFILTSLGLPQYIPVRVLMHTLT